MHIFQSEMFISIKYIKFSGLFFTNKNLDIVLLLKTKIRSSKTD